MRPFRFLAAALLLALALVACGDDGGDAPATATEPAADQPATAGAESPTAVTGGATVLRVGALGRALSVAGVELAPTGEAERRGRDLRFPIRGGELDTDTPSGELHHAGGLRFEAAGRSVEATDLVLDAGDGVLTGELAGRRVPLFDLDMARPRVPETGDVVVWPAAAGLSDETAAALNEGLGVDIFEGGISVGRVTVHAERG